MRTNEPEVIEDWAKITSGQCRMARAALKLGVRELAQAAKVSINTITRLEQDEPLRQRTVRAIKAALEHLGIMFIADDQSGGPGVRLARWYSDSLLPALKLGFTPPKLTAILDNSILLEAGDQSHRIMIKVDKAALASRFGYVVGKQVEDYVMLNFGIITLFAAQKYVDKEYTSLSLGGETVLQIELGAQDLEAKISYTDIASIHLTDTKRSKLR